MNILDLVKSMGQPTTSASTDRDVQNVHDILGKGPYTGDFSGMVGAGPDSLMQHQRMPPMGLTPPMQQSGPMGPTQPSNAHENIDAEIQQNSLMNFLINALMQFSPLDIPRELYRTMDEGFSYPDYVPDLMKKRYRNLLSELPHEGAYGTMGQDFDAFKRGVADELGNRRYTTPGTMEHEAHSIIEPLIK